MGASITVPDHLNRDRSGGTVEYVWGVDHKRKRGRGPWLKEQFRGNVYWVI